MNLMKKLKYLFGFEINNNSQNGINITGNTNSNVNINTKDEKEPLTEKEKIMLASIEEGEPIVWRTGFIAINAPCLDVPDEEKKEIILSLRRKGYTNNIETYQGQWKAVLKQ